MISRSRLCCDYKDNTYTIFILTFYYHITSYIFNQKLTIWAYTSNVTINDLMKLEEHLIQITKLLISIFKFVF